MEANWRIFYIEVTKEGLRSVCKDIWTSLDIATYVGFLEIGGNILVTCERRINRRNISNL